MSAVEIYYASLPVPSGPYCAEEEDDNAPLSDAEVAVLTEQMYRDF
jgi:hypothetical protein